MPEIKPEPKSEPKSEPEPVPNPALPRIVDQYFSASIGQRVQKVFSDILNISDALQKPKDQHKLRFYPFVTFMWPVLVTNCERDH